MSPLVDTLESSFWQTHNNILCCRKYPRAWPRPVSFSNFAFLVKVNFSNNNTVNQKVRYEIETKYLTFFAYISHMFPLMFFAYPTFSMWDMHFSQKHISHIEKVRYAKSIKGNMWDIEAKNVRYLVSISYPTFWLTVHKAPWHFVNVLDPLAISVCWQGIGIKANIKWNLVLLWQCRALNRVKGSRFHFFSFCLENALIQLSFST